MPRRTAALAPLLAAAVLALSTGTAEAQRRPAPTGAAQRGQPRASVAQHAGTYRPAQVSAALARKAGGKKLMAVPRAKAGAYARDLADTVEVLFAPRASEYGHIYVRVGERLFDLPGPWGARDQKFGDAMQWVSSPMYGFVFDATPELVSDLTSAFKSLIASRPRFSIAGTGPDTFSCAGFCTSVLQQRAPELRVGLGASAIGVGGRLLRLGDHQGITIYGNAIDRMNRDDFEFEKIE